MWPLRRHDEAPARAARVPERVHRPAFDLTIAHGKLTSGQDAIQVHKNDNVVLRWHSDRPIVLHLHGYEIETRVLPGVAAEMRFEAGATGRFPIHAHAGARKSEAVLGYLEVYPE